MLFMYLSLKHLSKKTSITLSTLKGSDKDKLRGLIPMKELLKFLWKHEKMTAFAILCELIDITTDILFASTIVTDNKDYVQ